MNMLASYHPAHLALILALAVPACASAAPTKTAPAGPQAIAFAKGADHASVKGKFKAPATISHDYTVELKAGQTVDITIKDDKKQVTFFNVFPPGAPQRETEGRSRQTVKVRADGTYTIHAFMTQGAVDKKVSAAYELRVAPAAAKP